VKYIQPHKVLAHVDRLVAWRQGEKAAPVTVEWDLSNRCPLQCAFCHMAHTHSRGPWVTGGRMLPMAFDSPGDLADVSLVKRGLRELAAAGVKAVVWSGGGEPTTHPQWLEIVRYAASLGLEQGMYTLGGLLTEKDAAKLREMATWVVVSLDCPDAGSYALEKHVPAERFTHACNGLRWLAGGKATIGASFLLHQGNWRKASDMLALARSLGATYTTFRPTIDTSPANPSEVTGQRGWITDAKLKLAILASASDVELDVDRFVQYRDWHGRDYSTCKAIQLHATVTPDGRVWVCPQRRGVAGSMVGDLRTQSFAELWQAHPGQWTEFQDCRVMCRLHLANEAIAQLEQPRAHEAFV
jgi:MoaA/NifB/PqqE/SkfB family radical SAM enzyme